MNQKSTPVQLSWSNINYTITTNPGCCAKCSKKSKGVEKKHILKDLNGVIEPGSMLAIMGPSGSGKTSLLNVLSGKLLSGRDYEGQVLINGEPADRKILKRVACVIPQEDILMGSQTVREALEFYANLRLPVTLSQEEKNKIVDNIIVELGLKRCENTIIGYVGADAATSGLNKGISGGERKRLAIGCQLITSPSLIFVDEPTTGLDSFAAQSVIKSMAKLAHLGKTIIFTIHQPSSEIINFFDKTLLLGRGRAMYFGNQANILDYFEENGFKCPSHENPADFVLRVIHGDSEKYEEKLAKKKDVAADEDEDDPDRDDAFAKANAEADRMASLYSNSKYSKIKSLPPPPKVTMEKKKDMPGVFKQLGHVTMRQLKNVIREPSGLRLGLIQMVAISVIMGLIYLRSDFSQTALQNRTGALFFGCVFIMFGGILGPFDLFPTERKIFLYQAQDGLYSTGVYFISKLLAEVPSFAISTGVFSIIFYFMVGFKETAGAFFIFWADGFLLINVAFAFGVMLICAVKNPQIALALFPITFMPLMLFSGFYLNLNNTPVYFIWVEHLSFLKYGFRAAFNNEFEGVTYYCKQDEFKTIEIAPNITTQFCPVTSGDSWRKFWAMTDFPIYADLLIILEMTITLHAIGFVLLRRSVKASSG